MKFHVQGPGNDAVDGQKPVNIINLCKSPWGPNLAIPSRCPDVKCTASRLGLQTVQRNALMKVVG